MNPAHRCDDRDRSSTTVQSRPGRIGIESPAIFGRSSARWPEFVDRLLCLPEIKSVEIDRDQGTAALCYEPSLTSPERLLEQLAAALAGKAVTASAATRASLHGSFSDRRQFRLFRRGSAFSIWELIHELPGRIRVRDAGLRRRPILLRRLELELQTLPGVQTATAGAATGSLLIRFDPDATDRDCLLAALDDLVGEAGPSAATQATAFTGGFTLANTALVVATVGELAFPAMLPVSAVLLLFGNLSNFRGALRDLQSRRLGLPALHTAIVAATLASSGFIASSLMNWFLLFWEKRHNRRITTARQILGASVRKQNRTAWLCRDGVELETPSKRLQPGDVIFVREGDVLPVDGIVISGTALVDETLLRGGSGLVKRCARQSILRGTQIIAGELRVEVVRCGEETVAARIGQAMDAATQNTSLSVKHGAPTMADRAVSPVLITAGVGLMFGGATTAAAILRPDYATGPEIGQTLLLVQQLGASLKAGLVVRQARVFADMALVDLVLVDDPSADDWPAQLSPDDASIRESFGRLRTESLLQVGLLAPAERAAARAAELGLDFHHSCDTDEAKAACIARCQRDGHRVAYVGDCRRNPLAAANADVAIAPIGEHAGNDDAADVWLLGGDYGNIVWLCEIARASRRQTRVHQGLLLIPNLTCVAGAFLFGFTSLAAVVVSNLGTYTVYRHSVMALRETELQLLARRLPKPANSSRRPVSVESAAAASVDQPEESSDSETSAFQSVPLCPIRLETTLIACQN
ncbi:MAG: hypothetical protein EXS05_07515 [Planctomycetaceae bacterium]|nr:hypothetical protein [Planctomycetaceae bacterium]